jgi:hypothetical protein
MPLVYHQLIPANVGQPGYLVAKELAKQTVATYAPTRGVGVGIGGGSCCAALAVTNAFWGAGMQVAGFGGPWLNQPIWGGPLLYGVVCGNSQLAGGGLAMGPNGPIGGHAERAALTIANGATLYDIGGNNSVLFVELDTCNGCHTWLNGGGGGVANPFNGIINGFGATTLHVWWRWTYPGGGGVAAMNMFHGLNPQLELIDINVNW